MGKGYKRRSKLEVEEAQAILSGAAEQLGAVVAQMRANGLESALFAWSAAQYNAIDLVAELCKDCENVIGVQVAAFRAGRPSRFELSIEQSKKSMARRAGKAKPNEPKNPVGRPKKGKN